MTFLTILEVTEILCSFKLVLQRKTGKEIPESSQLKFLEKFSANNFALLNAEDNTSGPLDRGGIADLPLLCKFLESNRLFCFISTCKFGSFKNPFATITSLFGLYFRIKIYPFVTNKKSDFYKL